MDFTIEKASVGDISAILELEKISFGVDAWTFLDLISTFVSVTTVRYRAVADGKFAGFAAAEFHKSDQAAWISTISTMPAYRGQGIGKALLSACESQWPNAPYRLCVETENLPAIQLYKEAGYRMITRWSKYYVSEKDAWVMERSAAAFKMKEGTPEKMIEREKIPTGNHADD